MQSIDPHTVEAVRSFNRFYTSIIGALDKHILSSEYSLSEARVLFEINRLRSVKARDLTTLLHIDEGYLSRIIKKFNRAGLIQKIKSKVDGRVSEIELSPPGRQAFQKLDASAFNDVNTLLASLSVSDISNLLKNMENIQHIFSNSQKDLSQITIRRHFQSGDLGKIIWMHGHLYFHENGYGLAFESYVAKGLTEFLDQYDEKKDAVWIAEAGSEIIGFLALVHRPGNTAQLRYFLFDAAWRGIGLGKQLMQEFMNILKERSFSSCYLYTTHEQVTAINLYKRHGFVLVEEKESETFGKPLRELKFELIL